jgi:Predicted membrane GTPase involved in stress response
MVDAVLLVVDAAEGPMPQTRFVTQKAFAQGLKPIVVVNKVDKVGADPHGAIDKVFDLFDQLGATDEQLDFPIVYCSAINGLSGPEPDEMVESMEPVLQAIVDHCPVPEVDRDGPLQLQISALDYNTFQGVIGVGRIRRGTLKRNQQVSVVDREGATRKR